MEKSVNESVIEKLKKCITEKLGFEENDGSFCKILKEEKDFKVNDATILGILDGTLFGGKKEYLYICTESEYIPNTIEECLDDILPLTETEKHWLFDEECNGFDEVSEWLYDNLEVTCDHDKVDEYVEKVIKKLSDGENSSMVIALIDSQNDCSFAIRIANAAVKEKAKEYMKEGLKAWYCAAHVPVDYDGKYWDSDEVEGFYGAGYAEPTEELLDKAGIEYELVDIEYDEDENVSNADEVVIY